MQPSAPGSAMSQASSQGRQQPVSQFNPPPMATPSGGIAPQNPTFQQHMQNPQIQQAMNSIGQFLGAIGHPLAQFFTPMAQGAGAALGGAAGGAVGMGQPSQQPFSGTPQPTPQGQ